VSDDGPSAGGDGDEGEDETEAVAETETADLADEFAPPDPLSSEVIGRMVRDLRSDWRVHDATALDEGSDAVYVLDVATGRPDDGETTDRRAVLKCAGFTDLGSPLIESHVLEPVAREAPVPVPEVYGFRAARPDLPTPFLLMEYCEGEVVTHDDFSPAATERVAREAGRNLGHVHALAADPHAGVVVDGYGDLVCEAGVVRVDPDDRETAWRERRRAVAERSLDRLADTRFADGADRLRSGVEDRLPALDHPAAPVLGHTDYRYGNLLLDPETGETRAVLDRGGVTAVPPLDDLVGTEQSLCGRAPLGSPERERVRRALREGYESVRGADAADADPAERDCTSCSRNSPRCAGSRCGTPTPTRPGRSGWRPSGGGRYGASPTGRPSG
jgi:hypothetical protein